MKTPSISPFRNSNTIKTLRAFSLVALGALLAGCPASQEKPAPSPSGKIVIKGSNTVGEELGPRLIAEYKKTHPAFDADLHTRGSASGYWGVIASVCDIAAASRPMIKDEQLQAQVRGIELNDYVIGAYGVAVVANAGIAVADLTPAQVRDIFAGAVQNWRDVGGPDRPIHVYIRNPVSGTYLGFQELAMQNLPYTTNATELLTYSEIADAVAKDGNGIGYTTIQLASKPGAKGVSIGGVPPTAAAVKDGKYPYARVLHLCTDKSKEAPVAHEFIQFVLSPQGQDIIEQMGFVRRP